MIGRDPPPPPNLDHNDTDIGLVEDLTMHHIQRHQYVTTGQNHKAFWLKSMKTYTCTYMKIELQRLSTLYL